MFYKLTLILLIALSLLGCENDHYDQYPKVDNVIHYRLDAVQANYQVGGPMLVRLYATNMSDKDVYLIRQHNPFCLLSKNQLVLDAPAFTVKLNGSKVPYTAFTEALKKVDAREYLLIPPGVTISIDVNLSKSYQVDKPGSYRIKYRGKTLYSKNKDLKLPKPVVCPVDATLIIVKAKANKTQQVKQRLILGYQDADITLRYYSTPGEKGDLAKYRVSIYNNKEVFHEDYKQINVWVGDYGHWLQCKISEYNTSIRQMELNSFGNISAILSNQRTRSRKQNGKQLPGKNGYLVQTTSFNEFINKENPRERPFELTRLALFDLELRKLTYQYLNKLHLKEDGGWRLPVLANRLLNYSVGYFTKPPKAAIAFNYNLPKNIKPKNVEWKYGNFIFRPRFLEKEQRHILSIYVSSRGYRDQKWIDIDKATYQQLLKYCHYLSQKENHKEKAYKDYLLQGLIAIDTATKSKYCLAMFLSNESAAKQYKTLMPNFPNGLIENK